MIDYATTERLQFLSEIFKDEEAAWRLEAKRSEARIKLAQISKRHPEWIVKKIVRFESAKEYTKPKPLEEIWIAYGSGGGINSTQTFYPGTNGKF